MEPYCRTDYQIEFDISFLIYIDSGGRHFSFGLNPWIRQLMLTQLRLKIYFELINAKLINLSTMLQFSSAQENLSSKIMQLKKGVSQGGPVRDFFGI